MSQSKINQPTSEQIERWKQIDELEHGATAGFPRQNKMIKM